MYKNYNMLLCENYKKGLGINTSRTTTDLFVDIEQTTSVSIKGLINNR